MVGPGYLSGLLITGIGMTDHAQSGIIMQYAAQSLIRLRGTICHDDHAGVDRITHAYATAMMQ